jgi:serine protease Do
MTRWSIALVCFIIGGLAGGFIAGPFIHGQQADTTAVPKELTSYRDIVKKVLPAVVSVESRVKPKAKPKAEKNPQRNRTPSDDQIPEEFRKFFEEFQGRQFEMPEQVPQGGFGSGFIVDPKGVVLTNYHVVAGADTVEITLQDGRTTFASKEIHGDRKTDLAIVRFDPKGHKLPSLELGDSAMMEIGDRVLAVGAPFGLTGTVTSGIISAKGRNGLNVNMYEDFLQTDAAINPGNSGGPLINLEGKVVGINSAIRSRTGGFQGVGLAIPSNMAKTIMTQLMAGGTVHRGYLGVGINSLDPELAGRLGVEGAEGVVVNRIYENSPAAKAGLKEGDVITTVNGKPIKNGKDLQDMVAALPLNKASQLQVVRDGQPKAVQVTIEEQPDKFDGSPTLQRYRRSPKDADTIPLDKIGVEVTDLTPEQADQFGYKESDKGALITKVEPGSSAASAHLRAGMVIAKVEKKPVSSASEAKEAVDKGTLDKGILLQVKTPTGGSAYVLLKAEEGK